MRVQPGAPQQGDALEPGLGIAANLWRGNYALGKTYWLFGLLGGIALGLTVGLGIAFTQSGFLALSGMAALWAWQVFISVAIWRSAGKYTGPRIWAVLARLALVLGFLQLVGATAEVFGMSTQ